MRDTSESFSGLLRFSLLTILLYFALQTVVVVLHEYAHSTTAWLVGSMRTPFTVVWGNPITILGWDEGVPYDRLFPTPGNVREALIGGAPLLMHAVFVGLGLIVLLRLTTQRRWSFYGVYLFVVVNLTELAAYLMMRPFAGSGDTGRFNEGLHISPWPLFVVGTALLMLAFEMVLRKVMPRLDEALGMSTRKHWVVVCFTAFVMFLWGSGFRILWLFPDRQWRWGLVGVIGFFVWIPIAGTRAPRLLSGA